MTMSYETITRIKKCHAKSPRRKGWNEIGSILANAIDNTRNSAFDECISKINQKT